jgi:uncharacterized protein DUF4157/DNA/RNA non-specific endonuclease
MSAPRQGGLATRPQETAATAAAKSETDRGKRVTAPTVPSHEANHTKAGPIPAPRRPGGSSGQPLPAVLRDRFAPVVGPAAAQAARVHTGPAAQSWALQQQARAVADGTDIYFAEGEYRPGTHAGDVLIAHELAHVSQALRGLLDHPARWATVAAERNAMEADADAAAQQVTDEAGQEHPQEPAESPLAALAAQIASLAASTTAQSATTPQAADANQPAGAQSAAAQPTAAPEAETTPAVDDATASAEPAAVDDTATAVEAAPDAAATRTAALPPGLPLMPDPPATLSPAEQHRVTGAQRRAAATASSTATAPKPAENVASAQTAVAVPQAESNARAAAAIVAELGDTVKPSVEIVALCERIKTLIREKRPADEDSVIDSRPEEVANAAGGAVQGDVNKNVDTAKGSYGPIDSTPKGPQPSQPPGIDPIPAAAPTPDLGAKAGTPDAIPPEQVNLDGDARQMESKAEQAGLNKESAQLVEGGPVAEAREARGGMDDLAKNSPAEVLKQQQEALATSDANMAALQMKALQSLRDARAGHVTGVGTQQQELKHGAEDLRTRLSAKAQGIYESAQSRVQDLLRDVPTTAMDKWTKGLPPISRQFKADLKVVSDQVSERHSGVGGFFVAGWDAVAGLPDWVKEAYDTAEKDFGDRVCTLITGISVYVNQIIKIADEIIADARTQISAVFTTELPEADAAWAAEQEKGFGAKLDALHDKAEQTRASFNKELIDNAGNAVQAAREEIQKLRKAAGGLWGRFLDAVGRFLDNPVKFIIDGLLELVGISPPAFWGVVKKIGEVLGDIIDAPMKFANNLMDGISQGFSQFFDNIGQHLLEGLLEWLLSGLKDEGISIEIPKEFSVKSVIGFFLQLLGISWIRIRKLLVEQLGEKAVAVIEKTAGVIATLVTKGISGILDDIKQFLDPKNIVDTIVDVAVKYITETLIVKVAVKVLAMLNPAGAILAAIEAIYRVLKWIFTNAAKIFHLVEAVVNGMADVISGNIGGVAKTVEKALATLVAPVIDFLADYLGLGGLPGKVANAVKGLQAWVEGVMRSVIKWLVELGKKLMRALGLGGKEDEKDKKVAETKVGETMAFGDEDESHKLYVDVAGGGATLMVASTPVAATAWLQKKRDELPDLGDAEQQKPAAASIDAAETLVGKADKEADQVASAMAAAATATAAAPAASAAPAADPAAGLNAQLKQDEEALAAALQNVLVAFGAGKPSGKWAAEIAKADPNAIPLITKILDATPKKYNRIKEWVAVSQALQSDATIKDVRERPLLLEHEFGEAAHANQAVPAVERAMAALGDDAPEGSAEDIVSGYKAQVHAKTSPFASSAGLLADQFFTANQKPSVTTTLQNEFKSKLVLVEEEEHKRFKPLNLIETTVDDKVIAIAYDTEDGSHFNVTFDANGMVQSITGAQLTLKLEGAPRGVTSDSGRKTPGQGIDSSHLIADRFGGSGYAKSANLISASAAYNRDDMRGIEDAIALWIDANNILSFTMEVKVTWGEVAGPKAIAAIEDEHPEYAVPRRRKKLEKDLNAFLARNSQNLKRCMSTIYKVTPTDPASNPKVWELGADTHLGLKR